MPPPPLRIAGASRFWGDRNDALLDPVRGGPVDFAASGNFAGGWEAVPDLARLGHPIPEVDEYGDCTAASTAAPELEIPDDLDVPSLT